MRAVSGSHRPQLNALSCWPTATAVRALSSEVLVTHGRSKVEHEGWVWGCKVRLRWFSEHLDSHQSPGHQIVYLELEDQGQERPPIPMPGPGEGGC